MTQPLSPQELAYLQQLFNRGRSAGQIAAPGQPGPGMMASLTPPSQRQRVFQGTTFEEQDVATPMPWMPMSSEGNWIAQIRRDRTATFTNPTINQQSSTTLGFSTPAVCYALTGWAYTTDGAALPMGQDALSTFRVQIQYTQGENWQTDPTLAKNVLGTAQFPAFQGKPGKQLDAGTSIRILVTPLVANLSIDVTLWTIETPGPSNISPA